jgi:hypothetical protein
MGPRREIEVHHLELEGPEEQTTADAEPFEAAVSGVFPTLLRLY